MPSYDPNNAPLGHRKKTSNNGRDILLHFQTEINQGEFHSREGFRNFRHLHRRWSKYFHCGRL